VIKRKKKEKKKNEEKNRKSKEKVIQHIYIHRLDGILTENQKQEEVEKVGLSISKFGLHEPLQIFLMIPPPIFINMFKFLASNRGVMNYTESS
jgi:hypothetical protein